MGPILLMLLMALMKPHEAEHRHYSHSQSPLSSHTAVEEFRPQAEVMNPSQGEGERWMYDEEERCRYGFRTGKGVERG